MQIYIECEDCGRCMGGFVVKGAKKTIKVHGCKCPNNGIEQTLKKENEAIDEQCEKELLA